MPILNNNPLREASILKSRDITLPTKVCLEKAMVFPVVMYRCENWTIKKAEHRRIGDGQGGLACCSPWGCRESDTAEGLN